jgi:signal transduction histidine kinase
LALQSAPPILESGSEFIVKPPPAGQIRCDSQKLRRVVQSLLSNAAKFTREGRVTLSSSMQDDLLVISVEDTGVGIAATRIPGLFETFGSSDGETASNYGDDVGLGLPLAYRYCQLMGGKLSVQSKLGRGAKFTITLARQSLEGQGTAQARTEGVRQAA